MSIDLRVAIGLVALCVAAAPRPAGAATFTVNSTVDATDGTCGTGAGGCTLREAIEAAVATAGRDTIVFDPAVFVPGTLTPISVLTPLPIVSDAAGTVIDGSGTGVAVFGHAGLADGLVLASPPGVPLSGVSVVRLRIEGFPGHGLQICGGGPPLCNADVTGALVRNVVTGSNGGDGIRILGRNVSKPSVVDSVVQNSGQFGITVVGSGTLVGARVEGCTARGDAFGGFFVSGALATSGTSIVDSVAILSPGRGFDVRSNDISKTTFTNVVAVANATDGVLVFSEGNASSTRISGSVASENDDDGIEVLAALDNTGISIQDVAADSNTNGIALHGAVAGAKIQRAVVTGNLDGGIALLDAATSRTKLSDVVAVGNNAGIYLNGTRSSIKRSVAGANGDVGIFLVSGGSGNAVKQSFTPSNNTGILISTGVTGNRVQKNVALDNQSLDLYDQNAACAGNSWTNNTFLTTTDPCVH